MKSVAVIPARLASTRLPRKMLREIAGKPLVGWVYEAVRSSPLLFGVIIATDSEEILEACRRHGWNAQMTSATHRSGTERVHELSNSIAADVYINVQGDEPLVDPTIVSKLAAVLGKDRHIEMITSASIFAPEDDVTNPNVVKVVLDRESNGLYFSRSPIPFVRDDTVHPQFYWHQGIYGYTMKFLLQFVKWKPGVLEQTESLEQLRALENGAKIRVIVARHAAVSVDTPEDVAAVERLLARI